MPPGWIDQARRLRADGSTYAEIGRKLGVQSKTVRYHLDATTREQEKTRNRERRAMKQRHAERARATCIRCGKPRAPGTLWKSHTGTTGMCADCEMKDRSEGREKRMRTVERLWKEGLTAAEIATKMKTTPGTVRQWINAARADDRFDVPYRRKRDRR